MASNSTDAHQTNLANKVDPTVDASSTKPATEGTYVPNTSDPQTGPAPNSAGPHKSDIANQLDPRVDSDLNNRAQYAPGTTTTGNTHPGATTTVSNPDSSNQGPHRSNIKNKLDPRVNSQTGEMTTKTTDGTGSGSAKEPTNYENNPTNNPTQGQTWSNYGSGGNYDSSKYRTSGVVPGSSTGAPAEPSPAASSNYNKNYAQEYNAATGTGYNPHTTTAGAQSSGQTQQNEPATTSGQAGTATAGSSTAGGSDTTGSTGGGIGSKIKKTLAGIHGAGESIRGTVGVAIDKQFNEPEGVAKNQAIAREGEYEVKSGNFASSTRAREGVDANQRQTS